MERAVYEIESQVRRRYESDRILSFPLWLIITILTVGLAGIYVIYALIKRRNEHFRRQTLLQDATIAYGEQLARERSVDVSGQLATLVEVNSECKAKEEIKSPALWIVLLFVTLGLAVFYILYFLTRNIREHDVRQRKFIDSANSLLEAVIGRKLVPPLYVAPQRPCLLYLLALISLSIADGAVTTYGFFMPEIMFVGWILSFLTVVLVFYWWYIIFKDYNDHFKAQWSWEDQLLAVIK